jgi:2-dehydropantoate 2-reductase
MQRESGVHPSPACIEHALLDHVRCAVLSLLSGLEHEHDITGELVALCAQHSGSADEHRRVQVMSARVHRVAGGGKVTAAAFSDRQGVHVATQQHRPACAGSGPAQYGRHRRQRLTRGDVERQAVEGGKDPLLGARELQAELGLLMKRPAKPDEVVLMGAGVVEQGHARMMAPMRYVVVGAGAVGGTVGGRLYDAGHDVVLVARGAHGEAMRRDGLRLAMPDRAVTLHPPIATSVRDVALGPGDVVLLATKSQDTAPALNDIAEQRRDLPIACVQNGVANERMALEQFTDVYGVVVMLPAVLLEPGQIDAQGHPFSGLLDVGRAPAGIDDLAKQIAADLSDSGFVSQAVPDIMRWKYAKLIRNLGNAMEALCKPEDGGAALDQESKAAVIAIDALLRDEAIACFDATGIDWTRDEEWFARRKEQVKWAPVQGRGRAGGSTWQSLARGTGTVEADFLNGEITALGRRHGVATPANARLQQLAQQAAYAGAGPGSMTYGELLDRLTTTSKELSDD